MNTLKIAIVDIIGLNYDGTTLSKKGIGGSESAIISMARELAKIGFDVKIFNDCLTAETAPGVYDGVEYLPVTSLGDRDYGFDIVISQRTVIPFTPIELYDQVKQPPPRDFDPKLFLQLQRAEQFKIVWMEDTFIWGDHLLEHLVTNNYVDEIFCLSDWHISYTATTFSHGPRRNFEVLKNYIWHTRNGINRWMDWTDVKAKDPNLFVYNASITKGMEPLVRDIWPKIKQRFPQAKLKIIGGYYKFRTDSGMTEAQQKVVALQELTKNDPSVEFTGIIPQPKIAEIMASATAFLYPGAYPETSGISSMESIAYNTPIIGTRFGAMEESATEYAGYYIDYPIEPNGLFPWINKQQQVDRYVDLVTRVIQDPYLHQQKQYACNASHDVLNWDTVALQWKQHFYNTYDIPLTAEEQERVDWINYRVHKVFARRYVNEEDVIVYDPPVALTQLPNPTVKLAFIDIVGMAYDGDTLNRKGLGGSESAVILNARELVKLGIDVTVFNACDEDDNKPGTYDGVCYRPLSELSQADVYDVIISSRVVTPFITERWYDYPQTTNRKVDYSIFKRMRESAKLKVFWMHDTFCWGDDVLEDLVSAGAIDEIWTLSDFHAMYVMNAAHPRLRHFETLRRHMWTTRNGIVKYFDSVDIDAKDPNKFIFNANMSKGLDPLLNLVWPRVKAQLPNARLTVIGGHYKLGAAFAHGDEESEFMKIAGPHMEDPTITFTGIVSQREVAEHSASASYFIYPAALPETYGISTVEALYANTPLLTCRFGALEETAGPHSYLIDYPIVPNGLFPNINPEEQADKFADMVVAAYNNPAEHRRRMLALDEIKDLVGWEVTALEWKQHIYNKLGLYLSREEHQQARYTKSKYHLMFGRRSSTEEEWLAPKQTKEKKIVVISPLYNAQDYVARCIVSVAAQDYDNYEHWLIDDCSTDNTYQVLQDTINQLPIAIQPKFKIVKNAENKGAGFNYVTNIQALAPDTIAMMLDGDDWLKNSPDIFDYYNKLHNDYDFTYGSCWSVVDSIPLITQPYPPEVKAAKSYKDYKFNWNIPYTHLRTLKAKLLIDAPDSAFQDKDGLWYKAGNDLPIFYTAIKAADSNRVYAVSDIVHNYNDASPLNDYKVNRTEQDRTIADTVPNYVPAPVVPKPQPQMNKSKKRILIAIPSNKLIEPETFKSIYDQIIPDGYETVFQYFWGYQVEQVRNLIAHWTIHNGFDYLFTVDSDISFPPDTIQRLLSHNKDIVSGVYIQRIQGQHTIEIMRRNDRGGVAHIDWATIKGQGLVPIDGCGFGCVLVKREVFVGMEYPHFVYKSAIDHKNTISEDVYFCMKARERGFTLWCDTDVICDHTGSWTFRVDRNMPAKSQESAEQKRLRELSSWDLLPQKHFDYLQRMRDEMNIQPRVVYDIGACVLHWTNKAKIVWPGAEYCVCEAMDATEFLYKEAGLKYNLGLLSDQDGKEIAFYQNTEHPGGNSYYRENEEYSPAAAVLFDETHKVVKRSITLDTIVKQQGFPPADLIKMDVQGAELDVLKGAQESLKNCKDLILELQKIKYNTGAPLDAEVIAYVESLGFKLVTPRFSVSTDDAPDGDYHFTRI